MATDQKAKLKKRIRAMSWSILFIVLSAMILPTASYLIPTETAQAQVVDDENQRANFWRAVREGNEGYSAVTGPEAVVFINNGGQNWRQMRNGPIATWGGWAILLSLLVIFMFFLGRGKIPVEGEKSGLTVPRWTAFERAMHWYTAAGFVLLTITGLSLLFGRLVLIPLLGPQGFAAWATVSINVHNTVGPFFSVGVLAMLVLWIRNNIPNSVDMKWFATGGGIIGNAHPSAGKLNGGEKVWYWIVIFVGLIAVCGTGLALIGWLAQWGIGDTTRSTMQLMHQIHAIAAIVWIVVFFGHVYIGTIGTEGALDGMTTGRVSVEWAKQHHDLWYEEVKDQAAAVDKGESAPANAETSTT